MVDRYDPQCNIVDVSGEHATFDDGQWVKYDDYAKLEAENKSLKQDLRVLKAAASAFIVLVKEAYDIPKEAVEYIKDIESLL